jgi:uncharacterized membrane protein
MRKWIAPLIVITAVVATLAVYPRLPDHVPTHWNLHGDVDGWSSRLWGAWLMPLVLAMLVVVFRILPFIDPRRENYAKFAGVYDGMVLLIMLSILGLHLLVLAAALGKSVSVLHLMPLVIGLLLVGLGVILPRTRSNWFIGIRTPWTMSSDRVWERTHRLGGYLMVIAGSLIAASVFLLPQWTHRVMVGAIAGLTVIVVVYSYFAWRQEGSLPNGG